MKKIVYLSFILAILTSSFSVANNTEVSSSHQVAILVNKERARRGIKPLLGSTSLSSVASGHAMDMYYNNYFSHRSKDGRSLKDRLLDGEVNFRWAGENIARGQRTAERVMKAWMNSPGHRKNILNPRYGRIGIARAGNVWVQNFSN